MEIRSRVSECHRFSFHDDSTSDRDHEDDEDSCQARELELGYVALDLMPFVSAERAGEILDDLQRFKPLKSPDGLVSVPLSPVTKPTTKTRPSTLLSLLIGISSILLFFLVLED